MGKNKTKNKTKKKTKKQKLVIHNRTEARKYIELMNRALKHMHSDISVNLFDKADWNKMSQFLIKNIPKFESALQKSIKKIK
jgi:hypothetical protein